MCPSCPPDMLPPGMLPGICPSCPPDMLPPGICPTCPPDMLPPGMLPGMCPSCPPDMLPPGMLPDICPSCPPDMLPPGMLPGICPSCPPGLLPPGMSPGMLPPAGGDGAGPGPPLDLLTWQSKHGWQLFACTHVVHSAEKCCPLSHLDSQSPQCVHKSLHASCLFTWQSKHV